MIVAVAAATSRLEVTSLRKAFGAAIALRGVDLALAGGEVVALVGENGAGKSTLIKILTGIFAPDSGTIRIDGAAVTMASPAEAMARGIAVIHQELMLCDNLSIAANLFLGRDPMRWRALGWIDGRRRDRAARRALERVALDCEPAQAVSTLGPAARQLVEIARALDQQARFVVMDEPSSSLDRRDTARLLDLIEDLRDSGIGVLYVSHRLEEVVRVADRAVVLRDGAVAGELRRGEIEADALVRLMIGGNGAGGRGDGDAVPRSPPISHASGAGRSFALGARELRLSRDSPAVSFDLRAGEILGLFGLVGAGRTELIETLFGLRRVAGGALAIADDSAAASGERPFAPRSAGEAIAAGLALVPEDRKSQGLVAEMSVGDNLTLAALARRPLLAWRDRGAERRQAAALCESLDVRPPRPEIQALRLSGGNQQKVVLGKWLAATFGSVSTRAEVADDVGAAAGARRILLLDEPTRGVDVGARAEIHRRLRQLASSGAAILLSSAESEEILALADRVLVLRGGAIAGMLEGAERTEHNLLRLAAGA